MKGEAPVRKQIAVLAALGLIAGLVAVMSATARPSQLRIVAGRGTDAPSFVSGIDEAPRAARPVRAALGHLRAHTARYGIARPDRQLDVIDVLENGPTATVRFGQRYKGLAVWGAQYLVHLRERASGYATESVNGHVFTELNVNVRPRISESAAQALALGRSKIRARRVVRHDRTVLPMAGGVAAYHFTLWGETVQRTPVKLEVFINSATGASVLSYNNLQTDGPVVGTGVTSHGDSVPFHIYQRGSVYEARDQSRAMFSNGGQIITHDAQGESVGAFVPTDETVATDPDTTFDGPNTASGAVNAHWGAGQVYEFYRQLGRNSIDDNGMDIVSVVDLSDNGGPYFNASWNGSYVEYGNPDPSQLHPLSADLDIVAHELTHGVTQFSGDLVYLNQSGAMNEAYSDYFGNAIDVNVSGTPMSDPTAGYIGEDVCKVPEPDNWMCPLRDLNDGRTIDDYIFYLADLDNGGVHLNSTIYAGTLWDIREELGAAEADRAVLKALEEFTTPLDSFTDGRNSVIAAAQALGYTPAQIQTINDAFDAKGIVEGWDSLGPSDANTLIENLAPLGIFFSPPQVSRSRYIVGNYQDLTQICCVPEQIFVGNVDGSGNLIKVGQDNDPRTFNDEQPDLSGGRAVWTHLTVGSMGVDSSVSLRVLGSTGVQTVAQARGFQWFPAIDGRVVAWEDTRGGDTNIWARRPGSAPVKVTSARGEEYEPDVSGSWIAWWDVADTQRQPFRIGLESLKTGKTVTIGAGRNAFIGPPSLSGKYVYWYQDKDFFTPSPTEGGSIMRAKRNGSDKKVLVPEGTSRAPVWVGLTPPPVVSGNNNYVAYHDEFGYIANQVLPSFPAAQTGRDAWIVPSGGGRPALVSCNDGDQAYPSIGRGTRTVFLDSSRGRTDLVTRASPANCS
jgi:beta propeller repeat protein